MRLTSGRRFGASAVAAVNLLLLGTVSLWAETFPMFFEAGYTGGSSLVGQGDGLTKWAAVPSNAASLKVVAGAGYGSSQGIASSPVTATQTYTFSPSASDLPGFDGSSSLVDFSLRYRYNGTTFSSTTPSLVIRLGAYGSSAVILTIRQDGALTYNTGWSGSLQALKADGAPLVISDTSSWVTISGRMDYGSKKYTLIVNGVSQNTGWLNFSNATDTASAMAIQNIHTSGVNNVPVVFDSLLLNVVAVPSSPVLLNNVVTEYVNSNLSGGKNFSFTTARDGWIYARLDAAITGTNSAMVTLDGNPDAMLNVTSTTAFPEAMRFVPAGVHSVRITQSGTASFTKFVARSIPEIIFYNLFHADGPGGMVNRDYAYLTNNGFLTNYNVITSDPDSALSFFSANIADWRAQGKKWLSRVGMPPSYDVTSTWVTPMQNPLVDGISVDEFNSRGTQPTNYSYWYDAIQNFPADPTLKGKQFYGCFSLFTPLLDPNPSFYQLILNGLFSAGYHPVAEEYLKLDTDLDVAEQQMIQWQGEVSDIQKKAVVFLGPSDFTPYCTWQRAPEQNYKNFIDSQFQALVTRSTYAGLYGIGFYRAQYMSEDMMRWYTKLVRHYLIEGSSTKLSTDPDTLTYVANPSFENDFTSWMVYPAASGSLQVIAAPFTNAGTTDLPHGQKVASMTRYATAPNKLSQTLQGFTVGRKYRVNVYSMDPVNGLGSGAIISGSVKIDGATVLSTEKKSTTGVCVISGTGHVAFWTRYNCVFQATASTAQLTLSDWDSDTSPGGPVGQQIIWDFVDVAPDYSTDSVSN